MKVLDSLKLAHRLTGAVVLITIAVGVGIGGAAIVQAGSALNKEVSNKLSTVLAAREAQLESYLGGIVEDLTIVAESPTTIEAVQAFRSAWEEIEGDPMVTLQSLYIHDNRYPTGEKDKLDDAGDGSAYSAQHARFHPWFHRLQQTRDYYDVFLFAPNGELVYTVFKELDYATNLLSGQWRDTDLGLVFRDAAANPRQGYRTFRDFRPYAPSFDAPASFIATPLLDDTGSLVGVLAFQMPVGRLNAVMAGTEGLGETGETYLVGADYLMRSDSRFSEETTILAQSVATATVKEALAGRSGIEEVEDYRGVAVMSAYAPFEFEGVSWAMMAEIDKAEFEAPVKAMQRVLMVVVIGLLTGIGFLGMLLARGIAKPIVELADVATILAGDDTSVEIPHADRADEIGFMAKAVLTFKEGLIERRRLEKEAREVEEAQRKEEACRAEEEMEREAAEAAAREERTGRIEELIVNFEQPVRGVLNTLSAAATELEATAISMVTLAENAADQVGTAVEASDKATSNVESVASASEELSRSIAEIARQVGESSTVTEDAVVAAKEATGMVSDLGADVDRIGAVIGLINDIAEQTNLLALNATIEAARAGDAGKGFAVVASEVKQLASETARATGEIETQMNSVQQRSVEMAQAVETIRTVIEQTQLISATIAAAVEEQDSATSEISRSAMGAADSTGQVTQNMNSVSEGATETRVAAEQVASASQELAKDGVTLRDVIDEFLVGIRAA